VKLGMGLGGVRLGDGEIVRARAPLRLGLAGGGTDVSPYCDIHGGAVLNAAISWYAYATIAPAPAGKVVFRATDLDQEVILDADADMPLDGHLSLHRGVWRRMVNQYNGGQPLSICLTTCADVPAGSGLGSSSTIVVAMVHAFREYLGLPSSEYDVARLAVEIERQDLGLKGGLQDQYAATFGGVNFIEFNADNNVLVNPLRVRPSILAELEASLVLYFTGVSRESAAIIEDQSNLLHAKREDSMEAMHELKRDAFMMKDSLLRGDLSGVGNVLSRSWEAKKRTSSRISNPMIERVHGLALANGAHAGKVSGAGGGGFMMFLVDPVMRPNVVRALSREEGKIMTCHLTKQGAAAWRTAVAPGTGVALPGILPADIVAGRARLSV
jgi:D-glycero-alpha-D-manno-heptose-7-phosphate kinase